MKLKKYSFNLLDAIIILLLLSVIVSYVFNTHHQEINMIFDSSDVAHITGNITENHNISVGDFKNGDKVYLVSNGRHIGSIISAINIQEKNYSVVGDSLVFDYNGKNIGVQITFETKVKKDESGCYINGSEFISPGSKIELYTKNGNNFVATIDDITIR